MIKHAQGEMINLTGENVIFNKELQGITRNNKVLLVEGQRR